MSHRPILTFVTLMTLSLTPPSPDVRGAGPGPGPEGGGLWPSVAVTPPRAATTPQDGALIVSIEDYADPKMADVEGARQSGEDWQRWFTQARGLRADRVRWLEDEQGTRNAILRELGELSAEVGSRGTLWVVFIGHGAPARDRSEGMLLGWAAQTGDEDEFYAHGVRHSEMVRAAKSGSPASVVMVLDACFSGRSTTGEALVAGLQAGVMVDAPRAETGVLMLTAAKSDQFAGRLPGSVRPAFSYLVLGALRGWADDKERGYGDGSGKVTAGEVVDYVRSALRTTALGRKQTPEVVGDAGVVLATIKKGELERGPDLAEIQRRLKADDGGVGGTPARPEPERKVEVERVDVGGGRVDLGLDVKGAKAREALAAFEAKVAAAKGLQGDVSRGPEDKAAAWDAVASDAIVGQEAAKSTARDNAASWRRVAGKRGAMRETWGELSEALELRTLSVAEKKRAVERFLEGYESLGPEPELGSARAALETLRAGRDTAKAAPVVAAARGSAPKGYVRIEPGRFTMGSPASEPGRDDDETAHEVRITRAFYLKTTEVTQGEWKAVMGSSPSRFGSCGDDCPVEGVSWFDAVAYVNALSTREGLEACYRTSGCGGTPGGGCSDWSKGWCEGDYRCDEVTFVGLQCKGYRLPTEAEWEYAARAGTTSALYSGPLTIRGKNDGPELDAIAWYGGNSGVSYSDAWNCSGWPEKQFEASRCGTHPVGRKQANPWGLYDMLGNVWEWVHDWKGTYASSATDPTGPSAGGVRVLRGGGWYYSAGFVRAADRVDYEPGNRGFLGLRPARSVP
ncbi:MAG: SUMF1/EgtB/PvdO family nonheme iron enzyme [Polyangiaceae bacterium]|nr:SUMF1/EgtB/PvdO family nonheme iron enzyme [Polyangiaceae bacterium]